LSSSIVISTDVDPAENRTTVPTTWSTPPSGVPDEEADGVAGAIVGGTTVGATVDGGLVGMATVTVGVGGIAADGNVDVGVDAQAATKTIARMSTII
jgi:hypothetical protein